MRGYKTREQLQEEAARKEKEETARRQRELQEAERHASSKKKYMIVFILVMLTVLLEIGVFMANHSTESRGDDSEPNYYELTPDSDTLQAPVYVEVEDSDSTIVGPEAQAAPAAEVDSSYCWEYEEAETSAAE